MKKKLFLILGLCLLVACSNNKDQEAASVEVEKNIEKTQEVKDPEGQIPSALPPMVQVNGKVYKTTGYVNSLVTCGMTDGTITETVESSQSPREDDQGNFGTGYDYQYWEDPYLSVKIDDQWIIFQELNTQGEDIPPMVAYFTAKVMETEKDSLLVEPIEKSEYFYAFKDLNKPVRLEIDNLNYSVDGHVTTKDLEGKIVKVYFDSKIENIEAENSSPARLSQIYRIDVLED